MVSVETLTRALALWASHGERVRFSLAGAEVRPHSSESLQECIYVWLQDHGTPDVRSTLSMQIARAMCWWADGAELDGKSLDVRAGFKAIELLIGLSAALPAGLDNAGPLLKVLKSQRFESLPDQGLGEVPLRPALLTMAVSALGSWVLFDDFDISKYGNGLRTDAAALLNYVSRLPMDSHDALVCFAAVLRVSPNTLKVALSNGLKSKLPPFKDIKNNDGSYTAVKNLLSHAARKNPGEISRALKSSGLHPYLEMLSLEEAARLVEGCITNAYMDPQKQNYGMKCLISRAQLDAYAN